ncbi:MAG: GNAT family N-acetyltransferase [Candidatus Latescibacterota bacterium]
MSCKSNGKGLYLLKYNAMIISCVQIEEKYQDNSIIVLSHVETHPDFQKRGIFGLALGDMCLRKACESVGCKRVELTTWSFNRKGIPFYKRGGFRAVPGTNLLMENYLPSIVKHPDAQPYFDKYDYIRTLQNKRSYGYDAMEVNGLSVFEYCWKPRKADDTLRVLVNWQKKEIVSVDCNVVDLPLLIEEANGA